MRAHAGAARRMPPVLHVAFGKLARRADEDLLAQHGRCGPGQRHRVLQLVTKAGGAAGLIEAGLGPQPARHRLVQQPAVDQRVEQRVGRAHGGRAEQVVPVAAHLVQPLHGADCGCGGGQPARGVRVLGIAQQEHAFGRVPGRQGEAGGQCRTRVQAAALLLAQVVGQHQAAACVEQFAAVAAPVLGLVGVAGQREEGGAIAEAGGTLALRAQQRGQPALAWPSTPRRRVVVMGRGQALAVPARCGPCRGRRGSHPSSTRRCRQCAGAACGARGSPGAAAPA